MSMKGKTVFALLLLVGMIFAIQPAESWTQGVVGKFTPVPAASFPTEGGNITELNVSGNVSTEKWAAVWGNVTGTIYLAYNYTHVFHTWGWTASDGGEVCLTTNPSFTWLNLYSVNGGDIDNAWGFAAADTDSATNTFTTSCNIEVADQSLSTAGVTPSGAGGFVTCALSNTASPSAKNDFVFCVSINPGTSILGGNVVADYALMIPTNEAEGSSENYNIWLELE